MAVDPPGAGLGCEAFARMAADPDSQAVSHLRSEALSEAVLLATVQVGG
jgi:hypothetical protein